MPLPHTFLNHLKASGYDSRSNKHSNALAEAVLADLLRSCSAVAKDAASGELVYQLNMKLQFGAATWNTDFVLGVPAEHAPPPDGRIRRATPASVRLALEIKSVMSSHRNAIQNRKRDFEAHHEHVHNYNRRAIAAGLMVINTNPTFVSSVRISPLRPAQATVFQKTLEFCVQQMRSVTSSGGPSQHGIDAQGLILLDLPDQAASGARYFESPPAPRPGDPLHYDSFIHKICEEYAARFG